MSGSPSSLWRVEGDAAHLSFHEGQQQAWDSTARYVLMSAGAQGGKTVFGPWWLHREMTARGEGDYLAISATYDMFKLKMLPTMREVFEEVIGRAKYFAGDRVFEVSQPKARIILRSADTDTGLESATVNAGWLDEAGAKTYTLSTFEAVRRRLSLARGRMLLTTTLYQLGWLTDIIEEWQQGKRPDWDVIQFDSTANPAFSVDEFESARRDMDPWKFDMTYRGRIARPAGAIYGDYNPAVHRVPPFTVPPEWPRYVGIDPGGSNTAVLWLAQEPEHKLTYVYRELHTGDLATSELVARIKSYEPVTQAWGGAVSEKQFRMDCRHAGLSVREPVIADVEQGISRVVELLKGNRLYITRDCQELHSQLRTYSRELDSANQPTDTIKDKDRYHMLDALRYVVPGLGRSVFIPISTGRPVYRGGR